MQRRRSGSIPGLGRPPGEGKGYPLQSSGLENPVDYTVHGVTKSRTRLSDFTFALVHPGGPDGKASACNAGDPASILGQEVPLEKEMVTHFSILAWKIPWLEEPGRLHTMGSQRVGHD